MPASLSIIIVNYNATQLIHDCLNSLYRETKSVTFEVTIVDNNSIDQGWDLISADFPSVKWLPMGYNAGFARANNAGMRAAGAETVLLLNPDIIINR